MARNELAIGRTRRLPARAGSRVGTRDGPCGGETLMEFDETRVEVADDQPRASRRRLLRGLLGAGLALPAIGIAGVLAQDGTGGDGEGTAGGGDAGGNV